VPVASVNGARINYVQVDPQDSAHHEDLVMVHGLATNMAFWYFQYAPKFAERFRVTLLDLRGHGRSQMTPSGYTPSELAADLEGLLDHLGIERAHFLAHSFGGVVTLNFARRAPERVASVVLADTHLTAARDRNDGQWTHGKLVQALIERYGLQLRAPYFGQNLLTQVARLLLEETDIPAELEEFLGPMRGKYGNKTARRWLELMDTTTAQHELMSDDGLGADTLHQFRFPALALYGERSPACPTEARFGAAWPHAQFRILGNLGHFFPASVPEQLTALCEGFWEETAATAHQAPPPNAAALRAP
jgi:pimeloyl-ACP methyl ester carboxylesterase